MRIKDKLRPAEQFDERHEQQQFRVVQLVYPCVQLQSGPIDTNWPKQHSCQSMVVSLGTNNLHAVDHLAWAIIGHNKCDGKAAIHGRTGHFYPNAGVIPFMR